jgi:hypothetical protein
MYLRVNSRNTFFLFLCLLRCFTSAGSPRESIRFAMLRFYRNRFPHSEISGSQVGSHLPGAYRRHPTSFIASRSLGIHHLPINCQSTNYCLDFLSLPILNCKVLILFFLSSLSLKNRFFRKRFLSET